MTEQQIKNWIKQNLIGLARFHKDRCNESDCTIQLSSIHEVFKRLEIPLTDEEREMLL